jgi:hypothetical protein
LFPGSQRDGKPDFGCEIAFGKYRLCVMAIPTQVFDNLQETDYEERPFH